jgi:hypothetical protein
MAHLPGRFGLKIRSMGRQKAALTTPVIGVFSTALARVARAKETGEAACDYRNDEDGPHLEADIDDPAAHRERVLNLRRDGQQLHGGEKDRITESVNVTAFVPAFKYPCKDGAEYEDEKGQPECEEQAGE